LWVTVLHKLIPVNGIYLGKVIAIAIILSTNMKVFLWHANSCVAHFIPHHGNKTLIMGAGRPDRAELSESLL
jgi:hypothetical protein